MANLERETEEALGLPPRAKYTSTAIQDTADLLDKEIAEAETAGISQEPPTASDIANTVIDFTPVIGDIKGGVEGAEVIFEELGKDDPNFLLIGVVGGAGVVGLIPGVGDTAQKLIMQGARRFRKTELNPELMEVLTPKDQETVQVLTKNTLPTPETDGERLADEVATMLREGKAGDITDEMLETAGNDFHTRLTQNYIDGNVGMDLPMDWESTMARSADQGLTETRYHGSNYKNLPYFKGEGARRGAGMFNSDNVFKALTYEGQKGETYSLLMRPLPKDSPEVDVRGASWSNLDKPPAEFELDARGYKIRQIGPDPESGPVLQGASTLRREQRLGEFLPEETGSLTTDSFMKKASELGYPGATVKNVEDVGASTPAGLPRDEAGIIRALAREPSQTQARTDTTGIRSVGARFDPRLTGLKNINMAQGGLTSMKDQTQMAFALGGEAETVDPVSGNDVPPGSLPEEVRDDIDAKLSEGEYVVPADVVRFFGVKYFEDLRTEAKMGLQQMDADGRIGGEPVQEQPQGQDDSMDVAELKAALSSSGMYAGGLTDGNNLDNFIDDASRDPMVNGRMRAGGATVKMAVGGLVPSGTYDDVTKVDGIIKQLMTAANNDPSLMNKLATKGIMLNKTGADKKPNEMQQANRPNEPIMAAEGTLVEPRAFKLGGDIAENKNPFDLSSFETLGRNLFEAAGIKDPLEAVNNTLLNAKGKLELITLIAPDGTEIDVPWNTTMEIPPGFTRKVMPDELSNAPMNSSKGRTMSDLEAEAMLRRPETSRETGDNSGPGNSGTTINRPYNSVASSNSVATSSKGTGSFLSKPKDFRELTIDELQSTLNKAQRNATVSSIAGFVLGPLAGIFGIAVRANSAIVERRIENELARRAVEGKVLDITKIEGIDSEKISALLADLNIKTVLGKDKKPVDRIDEKSVKGFFGGIIGNIADKFFDPIAERRDSLFNSRNTAAITEQPITRETPEYGMTTAQATEAAQKVKDKKAAAARQELLDNMATTGNDYQDAGRRERIASGDLVRGPQGGYQYTGDDHEGFRAEKEAEYEQQREDFFSGLFNDGGLVAKPVAKQKKKKQTTQRRKGLGTRP